MFAADQTVRMHDVAPVTSGANEEVEMSRQGRTGDTTFRARMIQQEQIVRKWSLLWRSIILSSFNKTVFPYCRYIRALNFRDLRYLLEDSKFKGDVVKYVKSPIRSTLHVRLTLCRDFFADDLAIFNVGMARTGKSKTPLRLDVISTIDAIGEGLTS